MAAMSEDPFNLQRFVLAQGSSYEQVLKELRAGQKRTHWMWYVFPQLAGLGTSPTARFYAIKGAAEVEAYLRHPILGPRLEECFEAFLAIKGRSARDILGFPDDLKLRSCATLFSTISPPGSVYSRAIEGAFGGVQDERTLELLRTVSGR